MEPLCCTIGYGSTDIRYQVGWKDIIWLKPLTSATYQVQAQLGQVWWACRYNSTPQLMRVSAESYLVFTLVNILHLSIPACLTLVTYLLLALLQQYQGTEGQLVPAKSHPAQWVYRTLDSAAPFFVFFFVFVSRAA